MPGSQVASGGGGASGGGVVAVRRGGASGGGVPETQVTRHDKKISCIMKAQKKRVRELVPDAPMGRVLG